MNQQEQLNELQRVIDTIITTAKLLGYEVYEFSTHTRIYIVDKPIIVVSTEELSLVNMNTRGTKRVFFDYDSYQYKLDHLNHILKEYL